MPTRAAAMDWAMNAPVVTKWFVRSFADGDTHRSAGLLVYGKITSLCGKEFVPMPLGLDGRRLHFPAAPPDPLQVCSECREKGPHG